MRKFATEIGGNIALLTALMIPVVLCFAGAAIDFYRWYDQKSELKEMADALATRGARELLLANATSSQIKAVINSAFENGVAAMASYERPQIDVQVDLDKHEVTVAFVAKAAKALLLSNIEPYKSGVSLQSTAVARGGSNVCVVALEEQKDGAVAGTLNTELEANDCAIMSNSTGTRGVIASGATKMTAGLICSAGGYYGGVNNYDPAPLTDCPIYPDPLAKRSPPTIGACDYHDTLLGKNARDVLAEASLSNVTELAMSAWSGDTVASDQRTANDKTSDNAAPEIIKQYTLSPGVYCGGIGIGSDADVTLEPGLYIIKDGPLAINLGGRLEGENVSFYLKGADATFQLGPDSRVSLTAMKDGALAGVLFFEDRDAPADRVHRILSDDARTLLGTFYLPRGIMSVASALPVADQSAYTVIVARRLIMTGSPTLVLNTDYAKTDVPVPDGVGPVGATTYLRE